MSDKSWISPYILSAVLSTGPALHGAICGPSIKLHVFVVEGKPEGKSEALDFDADTLPQALNKLVAHFMGDSEGKQVTRLLPT